MRTHSHTLAAVTALALATAACGGNTLGSLGDILGSPSGTMQTGQLSAEVRGVDARNQRIDVVTQDGRSGQVLFDRNTVVVYRQQQYPVTALERGDLVTLSVQQDSRGNVYATRIDVTQSVQERTGNVYDDQRVVQLYGRIRSIDHNRGTLLLQTQSGDMLISLPYNPPRATRDYFNRLRVGDSVQLEAIVTGTNRAEIYRFL